MIGILSCLTGVLGMLALWSLAWWLWRQASVPPPVDYGRSWQPSAAGEPTPGSRPPIPPPSWLFEDPELQAVPTPRPHPSSEANTNRYDRADRDCAGSLRERTELLDEEDIFEHPEPTTVGRTRKIGLFCGPRLPTPE